MVEDVVADDDVKRLVAEREELAAPVGDHGVALGRILDEARRQRVDADVGAVEVEPVDHARPTADREDRFPRRKSSDRSN